MTTKTKTTEKKPGKREKNAEAFAAKVGKLAEALKAGGLTAAQVAARYQIMGKGKNRTLAAKRLIYAVEDLKLGKLKTEAGTKTTKGPGRPPLIYSVA